ncbi:MAG: RsiV family protein [Rectinemataceae bacterium]|nr:RsiV family protein [Rectinemataceae bacterium]
MAKNFTHKWGRFFAVAALLIIVILSNFFIGNRIDPGSGLSKRQGSLERYESPDTGISLSLHLSGKDAWGFLEWPEKRLYGFFSGRVEGRELRAFIRSAGASPLMVLTRTRPAGRVELRFSGGKGLEGSFRMIRQDRLGLGLGVFSGKMDEDESSFHVAAIRSLSRPDEARLDVALRRGMSPLAYARSQWEAFRGRRTALSEASRWPFDFIERNCLVATFSSLWSVAAERYVFEGGAHGNTSLVLRVIDTVTGRTLGAKDIFLEGWEEKLAPLLEAEALRLFRATRSREAPGQDAGLRKYGFFEDRIKPSLALFLCKSGVGFHYDRYRLAPYSEGDFTFVIPWKDLEGLIRSF